MTYDAFAQPVKAILPDDLMVDKWDALRALTDASDTFDVGHRTLGVLKALLTFLPGRLIAPEARSAIVFPSNKTLSDRLNGMPDSTLRRHLAQLVKVGIVSRHESANRKRFARRDGRGGLIAFGFDLSPLALNITALKNAADAALQAREALMALRAQVAGLRQALMLAEPTSMLIDEALQVLRRKPNEAALQKIFGKLEDILSTPVAQNERHIQYEFITNSVSEASHVDHGATKKENDEMCNIESSLEDVTKVCKEFISYYPEPVRTWTDLIGIADRLTGMMGIDGPVFKDAMKHMGARRAATVVLCMLERFGEIRNPGGYLRNLTQSAKLGRFSERPLLVALSNRQELSADNYKNRCFSGC